MDFALCEHTWRKSLSLKDHVILLNNAGVLVGVASISFVPKGRLRYSLLRQVISGRLSLSRLAACTMNSRK